MHLFISYDSVLTKPELLMNPFTEFFVFLIAKQRKWYFNVFHSFNRPLTKFEGWNVHFIMSESIYKHY